MSLHGILGWLLFACVGIPASARELVMVSISATPAREIRLFQPLADYLAARLKERGVTKGRVVIASDITASARALNEQGADVFVDSPYPALSVSELTGARIALRRWKNSRAEYHSVFAAKYLAYRNTARIDLVSAIRMIDGLICTIRDGHFHQLRRSLALKPFGGPK